MNAQRMDLMVESVSRLLRRGALSNMLKILDKLRPVEVALVLRNLSRGERRTAFNALYGHDLEKAAEALSEISPEVAVHILESLDVPRTARLLQELPPDDAAVIIDELPSEHRDELLAKMQGEDKEEVQGLLEFPSETAGRIMTPNVLSLHEDLTVGQAVNELQKRFQRDDEEEPENSFYLYIIDDRQHLVGVAPLRELLMRPPHVQLKSIMTTDVISVRTETDQEDVARLVADYNLLAVPVVDDTNRLVGLVTVDDVIDVIREEATEDIFALARVDADDRALGFAPKSFRRRVPWLLISLVTGLIGVWVVSQFAQTIDDNPTVAILLPLVAALGGHAATQTMTVVVRGISTGEVNSDTRRRAFFKEFLVGMLNGAALGLTGAITIGALLGADFDEGNPVRGGLVLGGVVFLSTIFIMLAASTIGAAVPMVLKRFEFDPAIASSVFVLTITDVLGFSAFLGLATLALTWIGGGGATG